MPLIYIIVIEWNVFYKESDCSVFVFLPKRTCAHLELKKKTQKYHTFSTVKGTSSLALSALTARAENYQWH